MFARITKFKMKASSVETVRGLLPQIKSQIMALPGLQQFLCTMDDDGSGYVVSLVTDQATSDANQEKVAAIWANFADHLEAMPVPEGFAVEANWS